MVIEHGRDFFGVRQELGIRPDMLRKWIKKFEHDGMRAYPRRGDLKLQDEEIRRLRREVERLQIERDSSKEAVAIFSDRRR